MEALHATLYHPLEPLSHHDKAVNIDTHEGNKRFSESFRGCPELLLEELLESSDLAKDSMFWVPPS